jgi:hypothetical protein
MSDTVNLPAEQQTRAVGAVSHAALSKMQGAKHKDVFKAGELMLPWFQIVQSSSDIVKANKPTYNKDAREGDLTDTLTQKLRSTQTVILVKYETHYTTWKPKGGKLVKQWFADRSAYDAATFPEGRDFGHKIDAEGNEVRETPTYYILMVDTVTGTAEVATMAWGSTQAKKTRRLNTLARADLVGPDGLPFTPPLYARLFDLSTRGEQNAEGKAYSGWSYKVGDLVLANEKFGEAWYAKAEAFREQIELGNVRPAPPADQAAEGDYGDGNDGDPRPMRHAGTGSAAPDAASELDKEIPF